MYITENGTISLEPLTKEEEDRLDLRDFFNKNPIVGVKEMIDFFEYNKEMKDTILKKFRETLLLDKYSEEYLVSIYDSTRYPLYLYYKEQTKGQIT